MNINDMATKIHSLAWDSGWHSETESEDAFVERACNNLHGEISELYEAWRDNKLHDLCDKSDKMEKLGIKSLTNLEEEFADIIIRALDNSRKLGIKDIEGVIIRKLEFNKSRGFRHGNKRS